MRGAPKICFPHRSLAARPLARRVAAGVAAYVAAHDLQRVVCATVHEDVVAFLKPCWLFSTAVVTCVEINQCVGCTKSFLGDDVTALAPSSG